MMKEEIGKRSFSIWLIGDSEPEKWRKELDTPLDPRHPARHNIWTAVEHYLQEKCYEKQKWRFNSSQVYIRNAVQNPKTRPKANDCRKEVLKGCALIIATWVHQG